VRPQAEIRSATSADADPLEACFRRAYAADLDRIADLPDVASGLGEDIVRHLVWVAEEGDRIVGGLVLVLRDDHAVLANLAVDPAARGAGLARALIDKAETACRARGIDRLVLTTHVEMPGNLSLYRHLGWTETGRGDRKIHMEKRLDG